MEQIQQLYELLQNILLNYSKVSNKDIRPTYFLILSNQVATSNTSWKIFQTLEEKHPDDLAAILPSHKAQENFVHHFTQNLSESIFEAVLFQTELLLRVLYARLHGEHVDADVSVPRLVALIFDDTENNWKKDESKLILLIQTVRNTIHTAGIYFKKSDGMSLRYKDQEFKFEYGKPPAFLSSDLFFYLMREMFIVVDQLFQAEKIRALGFIEHPNYSALQH